MGVLATTNVVPITHELINFQDILNGALGPHEAEKGRAWKEQGSKIDPLAAGPSWVSVDPAPGCYDTRVWGIASEDEPLEEWLNKPFQNYKAKTRKSWLMMSEKEKEAVDFVNALCDVIELKLAQKES